MRVINRVAALKVGATTTWLRLPAAENRLALRRHNPAIACRLKGIESRGSIQIFEEKLIYLGLNAKRHFLQKTFFSAPNCDRESRDFVENQN